MRYIDMRLRQIAAEQGVSVLELRRRTGTRRSCRDRPLGGTSRALSAVKPRKFAKIMRQRGENDGLVSILRR